MIIENITCACGTGFQWENDCCGITAGFADLMRPKFCDPCQEIEEAAQEKREAERKEREASDKLKTAIQKTVAALDARTPARYRATNPQHQDFNRNLWNRVAKWKPTEEAPWLGLVGSSGACKTRCAYLALRKMVLDSIEPNKGRAMTFEVATSYEFSEAVRNQYSKQPVLGGTEGDVARAFITRLTTAAVVLFDDMGKAKNTPAVSAELFAVIDRRHADNMPMIWSSNSSPDEIVAGMSADMAGPLAGRLVELSQMITV